MSLQSLPPAGDQTYSIRPGDILNDERHVNNAINYFTRAKNLLTAAIEADDNSILDYDNESIFTDMYVLGGIGMETNVTRPYESLLEGFDMVIDGIRDRNADAVAFATDLVEREHLRTMRRVTALENRLHPDNAFAMEIEADTSLLYSLTNDRLRALLTEHNDPILNAFLTEHANNLQARLNANTLYSELEIARQDVEDLVTVMDSLNSIVLTS